MNNPWVRLPDAPPYVLPEDLPGAVPFQLHCRMPEPWHGPITRATVLLLLRNPGHHLQDLEDSGNPQLVGVWRRQLSGDQPFQYVLPELSWTGGAHYWIARLRVLIETVGAERLSDRFAVAQAIPYASSYEIAPMGSIPSAAYTGALVRAALQRGALVIVGRAAHLWANLVPELLVEPTAPVLSQPRAMPTLTPERLGAALFEQVVDRLRA